jgi:hypothetical protein
MINQLTVLNTVQANGADAIIDNLGALNITGAGSLPAAGVTNVEIIPSSAEQIQKATLTFTSANSTVYTFIIGGYAMSTNAYTAKIVTFTSAASATTSTISAQATAAVNALSDFNVTASDSGSGVVVLTAKTATPTCSDAPIFTVSENDNNIAVTAVATATCTAAPTGGRTAVLEPVFNTSGVMTSIRIVDGGQGYLALPTVTIANGAGAGSSAPTATAVIFEGAVVRIVFSAGTTYAYTAYKGFVVVGTGAALKRKYNYTANTAQAATASNYSALANAVDASVYTEVIVSYTTAPIMNNTSYSSPVITGQVSVIVLESATNAALLTSAYGVFANLAKGYSTSIQAMVALDGSTAVTTTDFVVNTGILTLSAAQSNGVKANDIILVGASPAFANTINANAIAKVLSLASNLSVVAQIGGGNLIAAITSQTTLATTLVSRNLLPR